MEKYLALVTVSLAVFLTIAVTVSCASPAPASAPVSAPSPGPSSTAARGQAATTKPVPKVIPHSLAGRDTCSECHAVGCLGPDVPASHATYSPASCVRCHRNA